jgi:hypothetical protein
LFGYYRFPKRDDVWSGFIFGGGFGCDFLSVVKGEKYRECNYDDGG